MRVSEAARARMLYELDASSAEYDIARDVLRSAKLMYEIKREKLQALRRYIELLSADEQRALIDAAHDESLRPAEGEGA